MAEINLSDVKTFAAGLSPWAHLATVGVDNQPDVVPVHPCWEGDTCWVMTFDGSVKSRNLLANPSVAMHWQVDESGNGVELWGRVETFDDVETKKRLWNDVFDYDLNVFAPGGPEDSPGVSFLAVKPDRAIIIHAYGAAGIDRWSTAT